MRMYGGAWVAVFVGWLAIGCGSVPAKQADAGVADGEVADAAVDGPPGCTANAFSCGADDALYQCDAEGVQLTKVQDCQFGCTGNKCNECDANTTFCSDDDLVMCDGTGTIVNPQACQFGCQLDRCNTCAPNVAYCSNGNAVACTATGTAGATTNCQGNGCQGGVCNSCTPNTTTCDGDVLKVCNAGGTVASTTTCNLGCSLTGVAHCRVLQPSYGVGIPSGTLTDLNANAAATLNITNCSGLDVKLTVNGVLNQVPAGQVTSINQAGVAAICVVRFNTIKIASGVQLDIINSSSDGHVLSLQAVGNIEIDGILRFVNNSSGPSAGLNIDASTYGVNSSNRDRAPGAGGGGAAYPGGSGGSYDVDGSVLSRISGGAGGPAITTITSKLTGGSKGGNVMKNGGKPGIGGQGGGGLQLVSLTRVAVASTGRIDLNGLGGGHGFDLEAKMPAGGGGSGGTLVVEAPTVSLSANAIAVANGGGGAGGCIICPPGQFCYGPSGEPGQLSTSTALGGRCGNPILVTTGHGGSEVEGTITGNGTISSVGANPNDGGGGGGSRGFVFLRGREPASVMVDGAAKVSPAPTIQAVSAN